MANGLAVDALRDTLVEGETPQSKSQSSIGGTDPVRSRNYSSAPKFSTTELSSASDHGDHITFSEDTERRLPSQGMQTDRSRSRVRRRGNFGNRGVGAHSIEAHPRFAHPLENEAAFDLRHESQNGLDPSLSGNMGLRKYLNTVHGYIGRNSQFLGLTEKERKELGGLEYDALCLLSWLVPSYFILFQLLGAIGCGLWLTTHRPNLTRQNGEYERIFYAAC
jgi:hypothetical protein